mgnify:CR=1 FL=1
MSFLSNARLKDADPEIFGMVENELARQTNHLEMIASENFTSAAVMETMGSVFTNKYAEGYPNKRYYGGCEFADQAEQLAIDRACEIFGCNFANVQPHSGANANLAVFKAFLKPDDLIVSMDLSSGGHLSHGASVNISGKWFVIKNYGVDDDGIIDYDEAERLVLKHSPKMIIAGASAYSRVIDWKRFRKMADSVGAILLADVSHYSGLIAGKSYPNPFPYADVVTSTTHKTLRGPRGGMILWNDKEYSNKLNSAVFPGTQGGPLMHIIAAKAQCFYEALQPDFHLYTEQVISNANMMAKTFIDADVEIVSGGTQSHMFTINLNKEKYSGREFADLLEGKGITVNKNGIPNDPRSFMETAGIRIGTAAETTRCHD